MVAGAWMNNPSGRGVLTAAGVIVGASGGSGDGASPALIGNAIGRPSGIGSSNLGVANGASIRSPEVEHKKTIQQQQGGAVPLTQANTGSDDGGLVEQMQQKLALDAQPPSSTTLNPAKDAR